MPFNSTHKYFIALVPPEPIFSEAMAFKQYFAEHYSSKGALKSPAHITIHMPFSLKDNRLPLLHDRLTLLCAQISSELVQLHGFGAFVPRVIYIHVQHSNWLQNLYKSVASLMRTFQQFNSDYGGHGFSPHLTIAFRDLKPAIFHRAWSEFENRLLQHQFTPSHLYLLRHDGQQWKLLHAFPFGLH